MAFAHLCVIFGKDCTPTLAEAYAEALRDMPTEPLLIAMKRATTSCTFFPKPVEIRQLAGERSPEDRAARAWEFVLRAVATVGVYKSPDFSDPLTNATIATLGGWVYMCDLEGEKFSKWFRMDFLKTYQRKMQFGLAKDEGGHLCGLHAVGNAHAGYNASKDPRIGGPVPVAMDLPALPGVIKPDPVKIGGKAQPMLTLKKP